MAYGGGIFSEQNKSLPGAYINFNTVAPTTSIFGTRGTVALALPIATPEGKVLEWTFEDFKKNCKTIFNIDWATTEGTGTDYWCVQAIRELFCNATKVIISGLVNHISTGIEDDDEFSVIDKGIKYTTSGKYEFYNSEIAVIKSNTNYSGRLTIRNTNNEEVYSYTCDTNKSSLKDLLTSLFAEANENQEFVEFSISSDAELPTITTSSKTISVTLKYTANLSIDSSNAYNLHYKSIEELSKKSFNILTCIHFDDTTEYEVEKIKKAYDEFTKDQRDNYGVKFQTVYFDYPEANHESAISLSKENNKNLIFWTAGALAGASFAESLCNKTYNGELELSTLGADQDPATLENAIATGSFIFHTVGDTVRVLDDINTYIDAGENKEKDPEIFNDNQSIRVIDQIGNDIATIFVNNYLGKIPSDDSGRSSFWNALVDYHNQMQDLGGIQNFTSSDISVTAGTQRNSVVVNEVITLGSTMKKLYMTVTVQ